MLSMARRRILPAVMSYGADVADGVNSLKTAGSVEPVVGAEYWPLPTCADMLFCR